MSGRVRWKLRKLNTQSTSANNTKKGAVFQPHPLFFGNIDGEKAKGDGTNENDIRKYYG